MRLKFVLLLMLLCLVVVSHGKKGKAKKGSDRHRDRPQQRDERERSGRDRDASPQEQENLERRRGKKGRDRENNRETHEGEVVEDEAPSGNEQQSREEGHRPNRGQGRHRLVKEDSRRHSSQQNGPMPPIPREHPAETAHAIGIMSSPEGMRRSNVIGGTQNRLSEEEKGIFLEAHNHFRSEARPYAANMVQLQWDDHLANMAQGWADECSFAHGNPDNISPFGYVGQNIWAGSGDSSSWNLFEMVESWDDEKEYYDYNSNSCSGVCGHYTQVVWAETTHVGCAVASCSPLQGLGWSPASILVCNYGEGGNYVGERPYVGGYPCSQCPSGYDTCVGTQLCSSSSSGDTVPDVPDPVDPPQGGGGQEPPEEPQGGNNQGPPAEPDSCGGTLRETSGELVSPNFPSPYDNSLNCEWTIRGGRKARISIQFLFLDIESAAQCPWDYLLVSAEDLNDIKYCGNVPPAPIQSSTNSVSIQFSSDSSIVRGGFKLRYMIHEHKQTEEETCGGVVTGTKGTLTSPGYPEDYGHNLDCLWKIKVASKKKVRVTFKAMDIENHENCDYDSLTLRLGSEKVPMRLCGSEFLKGKAYISLTNEMELHLRTDNQGSASGFSVVWKAI